MVDRTHRELTDEDIQKIASTYHAWQRGESAEIFAQYFYELWEKWSKGGGLTSRSGRRRSARSLRSLAPRCGRARCR